MIRGRYTRSSSLILHRLISGQTIEAILHCILSVQEGVPTLHNPHLSRLFCNEVLSRLPLQGSHMLRRTMLALIGEIFQAHVFITHPNHLLSRLLELVSKPRFLEADGGDFLCGNRS